jgi:purine-binding chemotaxis protein CheW
MIEKRTIVLLTVDGQRLALPLSETLRVVRAAEVSPLPGAPPSVLGVINLQGQVIPVVSLRRHLGRPERELDVNDHFLIVSTGPRVVALWVDEVQGVTECDPQRMVHVDRVEPATAGVTAVVKLDDGLAIVPDLACLLSSQEAGRLDQVLADVEGRP